MKHLPFTFLLKRQIVTKAIFSAALLGASACASSKKANPDFGGRPLPPFTPVYPGPLGMNLRALVAPAGTIFNVPEFLDSDAFFPPNASRVYDSGDEPLLAGKAKKYREFPNVEPSISPDGNAQWRFVTEHENTMPQLQKVLRLEFIGGERQM